MPGADVLDLLAAGKGVQHADDGVAAQSEQLGDAPALQVVHQQVRYQFLAHSSIPPFFDCLGLPNFRGDLLLLRRDLVELVGDGTVAGEEAAQQGVFTSFRSGSRARMDTWAITMRHSPFCPAPGCSPSGCGCAPRGGRLESVPGRVLEVLGALHLLALLRAPPSRSAAGWGPGWSPGWRSGDLGAQPNGLLGHGQVDLHHGDVDLFGVDVRHLAHSGARS